MKRMMGMGIFALTLGLCADILVVSPDNGAVVETHNKAQIEYLTAPRAKRRELFAKKDYRKAMGKAGYYPLPTTLSWSVTENEKPPFTVTVAEDPDFKSAYTVTADNMSVTVDNLKIASTYYWKVSSGETVSKTGTFKTADRAPRLVRIPHVPNVRDLGGRVGLNGRRVKQGLVYRTAGLNDNASPLYAPKDVKEQEARVQAQNAKLKELASLKESDYVPVTLSPEWTVFTPSFKRFRPEDYAAAAALKEVPETFLKTKGFKMTADKQGRLVFKDCADGMPAVFVQTFEAPEDGWTSFSAEADWYWIVYVNGELQFDLRTGNNKNVNGEDLYQFNVPVKKGTNLFVCALGSGSAGNLFQCLANAKPDMKALRDSREYMFESIKSHNDGDIIGYKPGRNRTTGSSGEYMRNVLGIKSDIDLRSDKECYGMEGSPLGPTVTWFHYSSAAYGGMRSKSGRDAFTKVFRVFLDKKNYPIDFHCIAGQDRTGAVAFILNALLGVEEDQLYLDWESTGFWNTDSNFNHKNLFDHLVKVFDQYPGKTINERVYKYVLSLGFTDKDIETFRGIMLE